MSGETIVKLFLAFIVVVLIGATIDSGGKASLTPAEKAEIKRQVYEENMTNWLESRPRR